MVPTIALACMQEQDEEDVDIENQYYNAKGGMCAGRADAVLLGSRPRLLTPRDDPCCCCLFMTGLKDAEDPKEAIDGFNQVVGMEGEKAEW